MENLEKVKFQMEIVIKYLNSNYGPYLAESVRNPNCDANSQNLFQKSNSSMCLFCISYKSFCS